MFSDTMEDSLVAWEREEVRAHPGFGFYPHTVWNTLETMVQVLFTAYPSIHPSYPSCSYHQPNKSISMWLSIPSYFVLQPIVSDHKWETNFFLYLFFQTFSTLERYPILSFYMFFYVLPPTVLSQQMHFYIMLLSA